MTSPHSPLPTYSRPRLSAPTVAFAFAALLLCSATSAAQQTTTNKLGDALDALLNGFTQSEYLRVDEAFVLSVNPSHDRQTGAIETRFQIADGYYLYRDKITFRIEGNAQVAQVALPRGQTKTDPYFGASQVLVDDFTAAVTLQRTSPAPTKIALLATYQGCADGGICYAPVNKTFAVNLPSLIGIADADASNDARGQSFNSSFDTSSDTLLNTSFNTQFGESVGAFFDSFFDTLFGTLLGTLLGALLAGVLAAFTPCVLPMLPILFGALRRNQRLTPQQGARLAAVYVLGTMCSYAAIGAIAGASGAQLQAYFQNRWAIGALAVVLVGMALSLFGVYRLAMPARVQTFLHHRTAHLSGNPSTPSLMQPLTIFALGALSALVVSACVSPLLISFLALAIANGDAALGALMMTAMAFGMGLPLIAFGAGAGRYLPTAGPRLRAINHLFGAVLIGAAIYLLGALPQAPVLSLSGAALIAGGVYLVVIAVRASMQSNRRRITRFCAGALGLIALGWGMIALIGGAQGERHLLAPLGAHDTRAAKAEFIRINAVDELPALFARAKRERRLVLIDFYADWCVDCRRMARTTFRDSRIKTALRDRFIAVQIDLTDPHNANTNALKKHFGVFGPPAVLLFTADGAPLDQQHFYGYRTADELALQFESLPPLDAS